MIPTCVGLGVTVVSAISPARRAVRIPPVAALVDYRGEQGVSARRRIVIGTIVAVLGMGVGLFAPQRRVRLRIISRERRPCALFSSSSILPSNFIFGSSSRRRFFQFAG